MTQAEDPTQGSRRDLWSPGFLFHCAFVIERIRQHRTAQIAHNRVMVAIPEKQGLASECDSLQVLEMTPGGSEHYPKLPEKTPILDARGAESGAPGASTAKSGSSDEALDTILQAWPRLASEHRISLATMAADWAQPVPGIPADQSPST